MKLNMAIYDFDKSPYENMKANILAKNSQNNKKSKQFKEAFKGVIDKNGNIGYVDISDWFHKEYGFKKPLCLGDKLIREIGNLGEQMFWKKRSIPYSQLFLLKNLGF